ncbi:hypothetical protein BCLUESOX_1268 [bacterium endosymbiont of Bathymodiolus sp. 5 South]|jgi:hypothetical protein|nr:hypothetical protein [uncultured Gammaproteobacteria bacterium]SHN93938.1 hypothetical protein BCLUESOX_1268 [bacterium endosymbiont of Bathymodiolus sp. 5 South]CAC9639797.1 hypothetical protein [uncultured Gammaproteobacteria bacterium]VVH56718.1 hypothetical protein BSPCLSOX_2745 [uncultured Gammaproteobacteria bacterium]VVM22222.1 hypothetical protein BSPWISOXPB_1032 [uncultured Gammaproteobacteria bacterium]
MITQTEIIDLEDLVPANHIYRKFTKLIDLDKITNRDFCITHNIKTIKPQQIKTTI